MIQHIVIQYKFTHKWLPKNQTVYLKNVNIQSSIASMNIIRSIKKFIVFYLNRFYFSVFKIMRLEIWRSFFLQIYVLKGMLTKKWRWQVLWLNERKEDRTREGQGKVMATPAAVFMWFTVPSSADSLWSSRISVMKNSWSRDPRPSWAMPPPYVTHTWHQHVHLMHQIFCQSSALCLCSCYWLSAYRILFWMAFCIGVTKLEHWCTF